MASFMKKYPGISGKGLGGQQEDISNRILAEARAGRSTFDVISVGTSLGEYREAKALAELHDLVGNARYPANFRGPDFYSWNLLSMVIAYNTDMVKASEAPQGYMDLLDPKWKGKVGVDNTPDTWIFGMLNKSEEAHPGPEGPDPQGSHEPDEPAHRRCVPCGHRAILV
jgi:iron(III) transport system substrate-binding protein